jgi:hypothetical protein
VREVRAALGALGGRLTRFLRPNLRQLRGSWPHNCRKFRRYSARTASAGGSRLARAAG